MKFIVRFFPEINIKSKPVRKQMVKQLAKNVKKILTRLDENIQIQTTWDNLQILSSLEETESNVKIMKNALSKIQGIVHFNYVQEFVWEGMHEAFEHTKVHYEKQLKGKTFRVKCKRVGKHDFSSLDVERYVGGGLNQNCETAGVKLKKPDVVVLLEIKDDKFYVVTDQVPGLGGYPLGCQDAVMTLISGGFDSGVAAYKMLSRGMRTHFLFFNLGGRAHEIGVKQVSKYIWDEYSSSHRCKFIAVPFEGVVEEILTNVDNSQMGVILKRMMYRAADKICDEYDIPCFVTGEAIGQVSSQTLQNLNVIDSVTDKLVLRPLVVSDKQDIIDDARKIGTDKFAETMPEYCGVISKNPTTKARFDKIEREEGNFDFAVLEKAVADAVHENIDQMVESTEEVELTSFELKDLPADYVIVDVRHPDETDEKPYTVDGYEVIEVPFYSLKREFLELDSSVNYALYCDKGVMSKLHAMYLLDEGATNVVVVKS
ncbi:tRNA uracil 4-sulfurtransferase ThiI [Marinicellulosiphila megalodicopiae]|uniref:tRNA uracil 4-sulfurtransferase ThiI n=1 Tax=Marinicellulosiphila megalodicopiae TaxID=2724896 RepID=UPI003BB1D9C9